MEAEGFRSGNPIGSFVFSNETLSFLPQTNHRHLPEVFQVVQVFDRQLLRRAQLNRRKDTVLTHVKITPSAFFE